MCHHNFPVLCGDNTKVRVCKRSRSVCLEASPTSCSKHPLQMPQNIWKLSQRLIGSGLVAKNTAGVWSAPVPNQMTQFAGCTGLQHWCGARSGLKGSSGRADGGLLSQNLRTFALHPSDDWAICSEFCRPAFHPRKKENLSFT